MVHLGVQHPFGQGFLQIVEQTIRIESRLGVGAGQQLVEKGIRNTGFFASRHGRAPLLPSCPTPHEIPDSPSRTPRYSSTARPADPGGRPAVPSTRVRSLASAWIRLASTAKPSPPTKSSSMHRCRTVSNKRRSRSLLRKRPWRFFEKVE